MAALHAPLLGLAAMAAITIANMSDNLITAFGAPSVAKLIVPALGGLLAARWLFFGDRPFFDPRGAVLLSGFGLFQALSAGWAADWQKAITTSSDYMKDLVIVLFSLAFFQYPNALRVFIWASILPIFVVCLLCFERFLAGDFSFDWYGFARVMYDSARLSGPIPDPNFFAAVLVLLIPLCLDRILNDRAMLSRFFCAVACAAFVLALLLTESRGGLLSLFVALGVFALTLDRRTLGWFAAAAAVVAVASVFMLSEAILERFELIFVPPDVGAQADVAIEGRLASWTVAAHLFRDNPLLGVGAGNFNYHFQNYALDLSLIFRGEGRSAHSLYLEILSELGAVGFSLFLAMLTLGALGLISGVRRLRSAGLARLSQEYAALAAGLAGYMAAMVFLHDSFPRLLWLGVAIAIAAPKLADAAILRERRSDGKGRVEAPA